MVKRIILLLTFLSTASCCDHYLTSLEGGLRSKRLYKKQLNYKVNPNEVGIKTDVVYKMLNQKYFEQYESLSKNVFDSKKQAVWVFKEDGSYYSFYGLDTITKDNLNLEKGNLNYLVKKNDKYWLMDYSTINCGAFSKCEFEVKNDTIRIARGSNKGYRIWYYYAKQSPLKE